MSLGVRRGDPDLSHAQGTTGQNVDGAMTSRATRSATVELSEVSFGFAETRRIIFNELTLSISGGEFIVLVGPSGCGKSTLLRLIAGLLPARSGAITIDGVANVGTPASVAVVFQSDTLLPWRTARRNVELGLEESHSRLARREIAMRALALAGLQEFADAYPRQLSGGMRQRVNLARAFATEPRVLLMDEPFAALDAQTRELQQEQLLEMWHTTRRTVVFVTHDIDEAVFLGDRVVVLGEAPLGIIYDVPIPIGRPRRMGIKAGSDFRHIVDDIREMIRVAGRNVGRSEGSQS